MTGQLDLFSMMETPLWETCFKTCRHFDSHPEWKPDTFPGTRIRRCTYHMHEFGTSGKQFKGVFKDDVWEMYCIYYEGKE